MTLDMGGGGQLGEPRCGALWDMDGVLVDTAGVHLASWQRMWREEGVSFSENDFWRTFGRRAPEIIREVLGQDVDEARIAELGERKEAYYREMVREQVKPLPGAVDLVRALGQAGFRQAVATSAPRANLDLILDVLGLRDDFAACVSAEDVSRGKPNPEIFLIAAHKLAIAPARCVVFEDSLPGIEAAHAGGMKVVAVTTTNPAERLRHADLVVESLEEAQPERILRLFSEA